MAVVTNAPIVATSDGTGDQPWLNASNVLADDAAYAVCSLASGEYSDFLVVNEFGFSIPNGATVEGIELRVVRSAMGDTVDDSIRVMDLDGIVQGTNKADGVTTWPGSFGDGVYGGASDDWSAGLDYVDINSPGFGFKIKATSGTGSTSQIQYVEASVYYSGGATGDPPAVFVQTSRVNVVQRHRHFNFHAAAVIAALSESAAADSTIVPAISARAGERARRSKNRAFVGFAPFTNGGDSSASTFVPRAIFARARSLEPKAPRRLPIILTPWPVPAGNGDVCACPLGAVIVERRFATARLVDVAADPLIPATDGDVTTRPDLLPDVVTTAVVVQDVFATAEIVQVCHC